MSLTTSMREPRFFNRRTTSTTVFNVALAAVVSVVLASCGPSTAGGKLATPTLVIVKVPDLNAVGTWLPVSAPLEVLPTKGRGVQILFTAPVGSVFSVSLRALNGGAVTPLTENTGTQPPPDAGYFQIVNVDPANNPPTYTMYVRAPVAIPDPVNYEVLIVNHTLRTDSTDSDPLVVTLRKKKIFMVTVTVNGSGHVVSTPPGIQCGTSPSGHALTDCSHDFGPGPVSLSPNANDPSTTHFVGWAGNCPPTQQVCNVALLGDAGVVAIATFGASSVAPSSCPAAPLLPGLKWADLPDCATGNISGHPGISHPAMCDAQGYFCCEPQTGASSARCGGNGQLESPPDCGRLAPNGLLKQPGGCYVVDGPI
jgi:hypothetical protein